MNEIGDIYDKLKHQLIENNLIVNVSKKFQELQSNSEKVQFTYNLLNEYQLLPDRLMEINVFEMNQKSIKSREKGNDFFKSKDLWNALHFYNQSIRLQCNTFNFALALANRSVVLLELQQFEECLKDIEKVVELQVYPKEKMAKLLKRKEKAMEEATKRSRLNESDKKIVSKIHEELPMKTYGQHEEIECASNCVRIATNDQFGRYVIATRSIRPGDVILIEKPFVTQQLFESCDMNCYYCHEFAFNLMPCRQNCPYVLFCSEICEEKSWSESHQFECEYLHSALNSYVNEIKLISLKSVIKSVTTTNGNPNPNRNRNHYKYLSGQFHEIDSLIYNQELRTVADLFFRSTFAALLYQFLKLSTFFQLYSNISHDRIRELLLKHSQIVPSNFHQIMQYNRFSPDHFTQIGHAGYSFLSLFNHSCHPNVFRVSYGSTIVLVADSCIQKGQQIFDSYGFRFSSSTLKVRQPELLDQYYFTCKCNACENNWTLPEPFPNMYEYFQIDKKQFQLIEYNADIEKAKPLIKFAKHFLTANEMEMNDAMLKQLFVKNLFLICTSILGNKKLHSQ